MVSVKTKSTSRVSVFERIKAWQRTAIIRPVQTQLAFIMGPISPVLNELTLMVLLLWVWCLNNMDAKRVWLYLWVVPITEWTNCVVKFGLMQPRPGWESKAPVDVKQMSGEFSLPSSDIMMLTTTLYFVLPESPWTFAVFVLIFSLNRLYNGAHYAHDCIAGVIAGSLVAYIYEFINPAPFVAPWPAWQRAVYWGTSIAVSGLAWRIAAVRYKAARAKAPARFNAWEKKYQSAFKRSGRKLDFYGSSKRQLFNAFGMHLGILISDVTGYFSYACEQCTKADSLLEGSLRTAWFLFCGLSLYGVLSAVGPKNSDVFRVIRYAGMLVGTIIIPCEVAPDFSFGRGGNVASAVA